MATHVSPFSWPVSPRLVVPKRCEITIWETTKDTYAVVANNAACLNPAPELPSLIFPMKNPETQHRMIMPTENDVSWPDMGTAATEPRFVLFTVVIMLVVKLVVMPTM